MKISSTFFFYTFAIRINQEINEDKADERAEKRISALDGRINVMRLNVCGEGSALYVDNEKNSENEQAAEKPEKAIRMLLKLRKKGIQCAKVEERKLWSKKNRNRNLPKDCTSDCGSCGMEC